MISTGNDIVSLAAIDVTRTNQPKFYSKILSESEKPLYNEFVLAGIPFENFVWLLWSIKESAYKYLQRNEPALLFTPVKFVVADLHLPADYRPLPFGPIVREETGFQDLSYIKTSVSFGGRTLYSRSLIYSELIHSVVNDNNDFENVYWGIKKINSDDNEIQSAEVRSFLLERLKKLYGDFDFRVEKNKKGCPILFKGDKETTVPVSLSHHENFVGYSFEVDNQSFFNHRDTE